MTESNFISANTDLDDILAPRRWFKETGNEIWGWGNANDFGAVLGNGSCIDRCTPVQEGCFDPLWVDVKGTGRTVHAIKNNGTLWSWGSGSCGAIGDGFISNRTLPTQEASGSCDWCYVFSGLTRGGAIKTDGTLWNWGLNVSGQLGDGTKTNRSSPVQEASSSTNWIVADSYDDAVHAIKCDGTLWSWGSNIAGKLGVGDISDRCSPAQEASNSTDWCATSAGKLASYAIKTDGSLWAWGEGADGRLGTNAIADVCSPVQEITSSLWDGVSGGMHGAVAIKTDGTLWGWGANLNGIIGNDNSGLSYASPVQEVTSSTNWYCVSTGQITAATKKNGTLWSWGLADSNTFLGDGTTSSRSSPKQVGVSTDWKYINVGAGIQINGTPQSFAIGLRINSYPPSST